MLPLRKFEEFQPQPKRPDAPALRVIKGAGLDLFTCERIPGNLRLTIAGCATQFKRAQTGEIDSHPQLEPCRECEAGSANAGAKIIPPLLRVCVRCQRGSMRRLIGKLICVNCHTRMKEFVCQRNARGKPPIKYIPLHLYKHDVRTIVARDELEAERVAKCMFGYFEPEKLIDRGIASPSDVNRWWTHQVKPWSSRLRAPRSDIKL